MSATGTDSSLTSVENENERLRKELEKASARNSKTEEMLHKARKNIETMSQELTRIKLLETQIGQKLNFLTKERAHLEETLIRTSHSLDKLIRQVD